MKMVMCAISILFSWSCFAQDFATADAKFSKRNDLAMLLEARAGYRAILDNSRKNNDYLRAANQYLRTMVFEATHFNKDPKNVQNRRQIYLNCSNQADALTTPSVLGFQYAGYYYFKSRCMQGVMQNSTFLEYLQLLTQIVSTLNKGLGSPGGEIFEGGGLLRIQATLQSDVTAKGIPGGTYNPQRSLTLIDMALQAEAYPDSQEGDLFLENYVAKIRILQLLRSETGLAKYSDTASKLAGDVIFAFNYYLSEGLIPDQMIFETQDSLEEIGKLEPAAMSNFKSKKDLRERLLPELEASIDARDAYEALTFLGPAFNALDTVVKAMVSDASSVAGVADAVKVLQQCQKGQEKVELCDTLLDDLIESKKTTASQKDKLLILKDLIDALPEKTLPSCGSLSRDECVRSYLESYLTAEDIKILESARKSLEIIRNAPVLYEKYATRVKKLEEEIEATRYP